MTVHEFTKKKKEEPSVLGVLDAILAEQGYMARSGKVHVSIEYVPGLHSEIRDARANVESLFAALDGPTPREPSVLSRLDALESLLHAAHDEKTYTRAWSENPKAMADAMRKCRELVNLVRPALKRCQPNQGFSTSAQQ